MVDRLWDELGVGLWQAVGLVVGTTVLFWLFTLFIFWFGQRMRARVTAGSIALMILVGSVVARSMLGPRPTMTAGMVVVVVLLGWEGFFLLLRHMGTRLPGQYARVVLADGVVDEDALRRVRLRPADLMVRLRQSGITRLSDVSLAIVERDGSLTVVRTGQTVDAALLADVVGA